MKTSKSYYFCQLVGSLLFFSMIFFFEINAETEEVDLTHEFIALFKNLILYIAASHFVLRAYIKKHLPDSKSSFKTYSVAIFLAAFGVTTVHVVWGLVFGDSEKNYFTVNYILVTTLANVLLYTAWSSLYLALTSIVERIRLRQQLKDHELASLMNQINPHFLFNSLNTIRGMIYEDKDKSAELVTKLSTLFRYNLSTDTKAHTSLGAELSVCQHYLAIEEIRLGERLRVNFTVSPESKTAKIPTMGLLTLIENAIKHGIANLQKGGTVTLNSSVENNILSISVSNPFSENLIKPGTQVGLKNLQQRIGLIFGNKGTLNKNSTDNLFTVTLALPFEPV